MSLLSVGFFYFILLYIYFAIEGDNIITCTSHFNVLVLSTFDMDSRGNVAFLVFYYFCSPQSTLNCLLTCQLRWPLEIASCSSRQR